MMKVALGHSEDVQAIDAIQEVLEQIKNALVGSVPQAGILFCAADYDHQVILAAIRRAFPGIELIGCSTDGELSSVYGFTEDSITLMVFVADNVEIRAGCSRGSSELGEEAGRLAATTARAGLKRYLDQERFAVILSDPINAGISEIDKGIGQVLGEKFPMIGAASAAHSKRRSTYQFYNDEVLTDSVVILLFAGEVVFSCGIKGGHAPMGGKEIVTSSEKNIIYRIGNQSALDYFESFIGKNCSLFMNYCLAVYEEDRESFYVRSAPFCDVETGSVRLNGQVPEGARVQIGTADRETIVSSCSESIQRALATYPGTEPAVALLFSCAGRKMIMGTQIVQETKTTRECLGDIPFSGFYSYGEFGPLEKGERSLFHGTTFVTLLIGPAEDS